MTVRRSSTSLLVLVSLVAMPLAGCTGGCSEDSTQDVVELWMPDSWVTSGVWAELELCQSGRCSSTQAPVTSEEVEVAFSDFGPDADVDAPGTLDIVVSGADGLVLGERTLDVDFERRATNPGCDRVMFMDADLR